MNRSNIYIKHFSWLHFNNEPRVHERQQKEQQFRWCTSPDMTTVFHARSYGRFIEIQSNFRKNKLDNRTNQGSNFRGVSFSNRISVRGPIQFRRESQPKHLKRWFFQEEIFTSIFTSIAPVLLGRSNQASWILSALKSASHFVPQSTIS